MDNLCTSGVDRLQFLKSFEKDVLGEGSFGKVKGNDFVAVKNATLKERDEKKRFNMEIKTLIALGQEFDMSGIKENGCFFLNKGQFSNYPINVKLAMERMEGDLNDIRFDKNIALRQNVFWRIDIAIKMLLALKKMHTAKLLHMDIKTDNVFMLNKYTPVLGDFGLTHTITGAMAETDRMGTMIYVGAEILQPRPVYSIKSDVYAMAVTIYELFQGIGLRDQIDFSLIPSKYYGTITQKFKQGFLKALNYRDRTKRQTVEEFIKDLLELLKAFYNDKNFNKQVTHNGEQMSTFEKYLLDEEEFYKNGLTNVSLTYKETLLQKFEERKKMYMSYLTGIVSQEGVDTPYTQEDLYTDIAVYATPLENVPRFFIENLSKDLIQRVVVRSNTIQHNANQVPSKLAVVKADVQRQNLRKFVQQKKIEPEQPKVQVVQHDMNKRPLAAQQVNATMQKPIMEKVLTAREERVKALHEKRMKEWAKNGIKI